MIFRRISLYDPKRITQWMTLMPYMPYAIGVDYTIKDKRSCLHQKSWKIRRSFGLLSKITHYRRKYIPSDTGAWGGLVCDRWSGWALVDGEKIISLLKLFVYRTLEHPGDSSGKDIWRPIMSLLIVDWCCPNHDSCHGIPLVPDSLSQILIFITTPEDAVTSPSIMVAGTANCDYCRIHSTNSENKVYRLKGICHM